ncbi:MAG: hypothetical protein RLO12_18485, partial [Fulvivirga sp.]
INVPRYVSTLLLSNFTFKFALPTGINDDDYLSVLSKNLNELVTKVNPDFVFFQAGVDVMKGDKLGKMNLTKEGVKQRDELVIESCKSYNIPIVITMGGGYSEKLKDLIEAHCNTFRVAVRLYS